MKSSARTRAKLQALSSAGDFPALLTQAQIAARRFPADAHILIELATGHAGAGDEQLAAETAWAAANAPTADPEIWLRAVRWIVRSDRFDRAEALLDRFEAGRDTSQGLAVEAIYLRGLVAAEQGNDEEAELRLRAAHERAPRNGSYIGALAGFLVSRHRAAETDELVALVDSVDNPQGLRGRLARLGLL